MKIYLKLFGSLLNVTDSCSKNLFIPPNNDCGECAIVLIEGSPSNTITRSARYVAIMKSCSTTNPVFLACKINLFITYKKKKNFKVDTLDLRLSYIISIKPFKYLLPLLLQDAAQNLGTQMVHQSNTHQQVYQDKGSSQPSVAHHRISFELLDPSMLLFLGAALRQQQTKTRHVENWEFR